MEPRGVLSSEESSEDIEKVSKLVKESKRTDLRLCVLEGGGADAEKKNKKRRKSVARESDAFFFSNMYRRGGS